MKKIFIIAAVLCSFSAMAQQPQATITYSIKMDNSPAAAFMSDMHATIYYKQGKSLADLSSSMFSSKTVTTDSGSLTLMQVMGQKFFNRVPKASMGTNTKPMPDITYTDSTKEIAGYQCKKALMHTAGNSGTDTAVFWYTEKLPVITFGMAADAFRGLKGMPLEFELNNTAMHFKLTAEKVSTDDIPDSVFNLSTEGYTEFDPGKMGGQFPMQ